MPFSMFAVQKENYEIINNHDFNNIMFTQNIVISLWLLLIGVLCLFFKCKGFIFLSACVIFINIIFSKKASKYIKEK